MTSCSVEVPGMPSATPPPPPPPPPPPVRHTKLFKTARSTFRPALVHFAVNQGELGEVESLITAGIDLNYRLHGYTPIFLAILKEQYSIAHSLADGGADVSKPEKYRWLRQPIHLAAAAGEEELVKKLITCGASVHASDGALMTPLHWAARKGHKQVVEILLDAGAHIHSKDDCGRTALFRAVECNDIEIVDMLAESGGSVNSRDKYGWVPLFHSIVCGHLDMIKHLLDKYIIDFCAMNNEGAAALHIAITRTSRENLEVLCRSGLDFYMRERRVPTEAVHKAIKEPPCSDQLVEMLIDYGFELNVRDVHGSTPFMHASHCCYEQTQLIMISAGADLTLDEPWIRRGYWPDVIQYNFPVQHMLIHLSQQRVLPLLQICRLVIRKSLRPFIHSKITRLPLPTKIQQCLYATVDNQP